MIRSSIIQIAYATIAANVYPIIDFTSIFSNINVLANADRTKKLVETGTPTLVSNNSTSGAVA